MAKKKAPKPLATQNSPLRPEIRNTAPDPRMAPNPATIPSEVPNQTANPSVQPVPSQLMTPEEMSHAGPEAAGFQRVLMTAWRQEWTRSANAILGLIYDRNPDELVTSKGVRVRVYQDMRRDPYVKAGLSIKKLSVIRLPHEILPASQSSTDRMIAQFVADQLEDCSTPWFDIVWNILDCVDIGYSIGEINWKVVERGQWKDRIGISSIKGKDPYMFSFRITQHGDVETVIQRIGNAFPINQNVPVSYRAFGQDEFPPQKFLIASFQQLYNNPYGTSDLRAAYRAFFIKDWAWKFRAIYMEKWGMPTVMGTHPVGMTEERRKKLEDVLDSIQNDTAVTVPADIKIELLRVATAANQQEYEHAISDLNKEILIGLIGSFLAVEESRKTGARAQGQVHMQVSKLFIESLVTVIQEVINKQLIRRLIDMNFEVEKYPKLHFDMTHMNADEITAELGVDAALAAMGIKSDPEYLYRKYDRQMPQTTGVNMDPSQPNIAQPQIDKARAETGAPAIKVSNGVQPALPGAPTVGALYLRTLPSLPGIGIERPGMASKPDNQSNTNVNRHNDTPTSDTQNYGAQVRPYQMERAPAFDHLRSKALPENPQKIGKLRETYEWILNLAEAQGALRDIDASTIAFELAGREREHRLKAGSWMTYDEACAMVDTFFKEKALPPS